MANQTARVKTKNPRPTRKSNLRAAAKPKPTKPKSSKKGEY